MRAWPIGDALIVDQVTGAIDEHFAISHPAVSRHLRVLRNSGVVRDELVGRQRFSLLDTDSSTAFITGSAESTGPARGSTTPTHSQPGFTEPGTSATVPTRARYERTWSDKATHRMTVPTDAGKDLAVPQFTHPPIHAPAPSHSDFPRSPPAGRLPGNAQDGPLQRGPPRFRQVLPVLPQYRMTSCRPTSRPTGRGPRRGYRRWCRRSARRRCPPVRRPV
ncbi:ArsR family transcriptional regulator [Nocardia sp. NPDC049190]|uniref:ArsR/SmtB family transcription factor n=1 Tax=Nocardia sp. NPDC049190 TaxID=3155650 RepID=UPI0033D32474